MRLFLLGEQLETRVSQLASLSRREKWTMVNVWLVDATSLLVTLEDKDQQQEEEVIRRAFRSLQLNYKSQVFAFIVEEGVAIK